MRALTMRELEIVAGGMIKGPGDGDDPGGGGGVPTEPPVVVTAPAPTDPWYPPVVPPSSPSDPGGGTTIPGGGGGSGSGGTGTHTSALAQSINDAFGAGSAVVNYTNGQATGASYTWQDYQSTSTVTGAQDHLTEFTKVDLYDGHSVSAGVDIKPDAITLNAGFGVEPFAVAVSVNSADLGTASLSLTNSSGTTIAENWTTSGQLNTMISQKIGDWTISGTESNVTGTAVQLDMKAVAADGTTETFALIHDSASSPTNHGGWGISYQIAIPFN